MQAKAAVNTLRIFMLTVAAAAGYAWFYIEDKFQFESEFLNNDSKEVNPTATT
ncbi:MAG: hypothetical protein WDO19_20230 [Bacteroidota bacterium]